eukprot:194815_1
MSLFALTVRRALYGAMIGLGVVVVERQYRSTSTETDTDNKRRIEDKSKRPKVGLGCLIIRKNKNNESEFLVGVRKSSHGAGLYALPGGHLEYRETWGQCAYHEVLEETNLNIPPSKWKFAFANNSIAPSKNASEEHLHYIDIIMSATYDGEEQPVNMEPHKCEGWQWVKWNDHNLDTNRTFCGLKAILQSDHFHPEHDYAKYVSFDQWDELQSNE